MTIQGNHNGPLTGLGFPTRATQVLPPESAMLATNENVVWVELRELRAEVERLRALTAPLLAWDDARHELAEFERTFDSQPGSVEERQRKAHGLWMAQNRAWDGVIPALDAHRASVKAD